MLSNIKENSVPVNRKKVSTLAISAQYNMKIIHFFLFFIVSNLSYGQAIITVVESSNGKTLEGELIKYQQGIQLELKLENGKTKVIREKDIVKITQRRYTSSPPLSKPRGSRYQFQEKGIYNATYFSGMLGTDNSKAIVGMGLHHITGYQISRLIGIGGGIGLSAYELEGGLNIVSTYAEIRGYLLKKTLTPYYAISGGYGWLIPPEDNSISEAHGGTTGLIVVGVRFGASSGSNVLAGLGYHFQHTSFTREPAFGEIETTTVTFNRLAVRVGLIF